MVWPDAKPGDVGNNDGDIVSTLVPETTLIMCGVVMVTREQAAKAEAYGWETIRTNRKDGMVDIARKARVLPVGPSRRRRLNASL